ncbi:MAG: hypothetical protein IPQ00_00070 [Chloracidobacterium sp.]|nr:hypothetical protein [Chloracidobacterium sp.]
MNVFEDLVVELKEENLLESTVIETDRDVSVPKSTGCGLMLVIGRPIETS